MIAKIIIALIAIAMIVPITQVNAHRHGYYNNDNTYNVDYSPTYVSNHHHNSFSTSENNQGNDIYMKGYNDAQCDYTSCNGHGYEPSCPASVDNCDVYGMGYNDGWYNMQQVSSNNQASTAAIGGNKINGDDNTINQQIIQQEQNGPRASSSDNGGDNSGQLPRCKAFCLGVQ